MAKADHEFHIPISPYSAFQVLGAAMVHCEVKPFRQEGWSLKGQEGLGLFKMGYPVTVTATVHDDGRGGSRITLHGENMGIALNKVHVRRTLERIAEATRHAAATVPPIPSAMNEAFGGSAAPSTIETPDDPTLPPKIG